MAAVHRSVPRLHLRARLSPPHQGCGHPRVDPARIGLEGSNQGGAIAIAAGALCPDVQAVSAYVPFLSHVRRATEIGTEHPYGELVEYLCSRPGQVEGGL